MTAAVSCKNYFGYFQLELSLALIVLLILCIGPSYRCGHVFILCACVCVCVCGARARARLQSSSVTDSLWPPRLHLVKEHFSALMLLVGRQEESVKN